MTRSVALSSLTNGVACAAFSCARLDPFPAGGVALVLSSRVTLFDGRGRSSHALSRSLPHSCAPPPPQLCSTILLSPAHSCSSSNRTLQPGLFMRALHCMRQRNPPVWKSFNYRSRSVCCRHDDSRDGAASAFKHETAPTEILSFWPVKKRRQAQCRDPLRQGVLVKGSRSSPREGPPPRWRGTRNLYVGPQCTCSCQPACLAGCLSHKSGPCCGAPLPNHAPPRISPRTQVGRARSVAESGLDNGRVLSIQTREFDIPCWESPQTDKSRRSKHLPPLQAQLRVFLCRPPVVTKQHKQNKAPHSAVDESESARSSSSLPRLLLVFSHLPLQHLFFLLCRCHCRQYESDPRSCALLVWIAGGEIPRHASNIDVLAHSVLCVRNCGESFVRARWLLSSRTVSAPASPS